MVELPIDHVHVRVEDQRVLVERFCPIRRLDLRCASRTGP
jgi:hypothetical protein